MSIFIDYIKENLKWIVFWSASILLLFISFGAGYLMAKEVNPAPIIIEKCSTK